MPSLRNGICTMNEATILCWSAVTIGFVHTLMGPDHYLPFIAMSRAGRWSLRKTMVVTVLCGIGHVLGSIALGLLGVALGIAVFKLEDIESVRGDIAAWMLIGFGLMYFAWSMVRLVRKQSHTHWHSHGGELHCHEHSHDAEHLHVHHAETPHGAKLSMTPWVLFTVFVFGPCEPLIPLLMYPAAAGSYWLLAGVTILFAAATILTMSVIVWVAASAASYTRFANFGRYAQPIAGLIVLGCGVAIKAGL